MQASTVRGSTYADKHLETSRILSGKRLRGSPIGMSIKSTCENLQFSTEKTQITPLQELAPVGSLQLRMVFHGFVAKFYNDSHIFTLI